MAKPKIIQWCTDSMGRITLRQLIDRPDIDLVGVYVTSDKKNGLDAGQIARRPDTGIIATNNIDEILKLEADAVIHTSLLTAPYETQNGNDIDVAHVLNTTVQINIAYARHNICRRSVHG